MAWVLTWNPTTFDWTAAGFEDTWHKYRKTGYADDTWSCGWIHSQGPTGPTGGGRFFALRVGPRHPGLVAAGRFLTPPHQRYGDFKGAPLAKIRYDYLADVRDPEQYVPRPALCLIAGDALRFQASGMPIKPEVAVRLETLLCLLRSAQFPAQAA